MKKLKNEKDNKMQSCKNLHNICLKTQNEMMKIIKIMTLQA